MCSRNAPHLDGDQHRAKILDWARPLITIYCFGNHHLRATLWKPLAYFAQAAPRLCDSKDFRIEGMEVRIRQQGAAVILEPMPEDWAWLDALLGPLDADFQQAATEQPAMQDRPALDKLFP